MNTPGPIVSQGQIWTVALWNAAWALLSGKVDADGGTATNLTITGGTATLGSLTVGGLPVTGGGGAVGAYKDVTATSYTTLNTDGYLAINSASPVTITLAPAPTVGTMQTVADIAGLAGSANITVQPNGGTISGNTNVIITVPYMSIDFTYTSNGWIIG